MKAGPWFDFGLTTSYTRSKNSTDAGSGESALGFSATLTKLECATAYHFCASGSNSSGKSNGIDRTFTTDPCPSTASILLVDDDDNFPDVRSFYTAALDALALDHDVWNTSGSDNKPNTATLAPDDTVIWMSGDEYGGYAGPGSAGETAVSTFLDGGGCLLLSSQDYRYDRGGVTSFMNSYLGVASVIEAGASSVWGTGSFSGLGPYALSYPFTKFNDLLGANASGFSLFEGSCGLAAIGTATGTSRTAYAGFGFECVATAADRIEVISALPVSCADKKSIFADDFEMGDTSRWSSFPSPAKMHP